MLGSVSNETLVEILVMTIWIVKWESGSSWQFAPYVREGMSSCITNGLTQGKVYVNDREVEINNTNISGWSYK